MENTIKSKGTEGVKAAQKKKKKKKNPKEVKKKKKNVNQTFLSFCISVLFELTVHPEER